MLGGCGSNGGTGCRGDFCGSRGYEAGPDRKTDLQNSFVGTVSPQEMVYVIPFASGTVTDTYFEVGDQVNAGGCFVQNR